MFNFIPNAWTIAKKLIDDLKSSGDVVLSSLIGAPNGVAGTDSNGDIVATSIHQMDTAAALSAITFKNGEIAIAIDTNDIIRGDGVTVGGVVTRTGGTHYKGNGVLTTVINNGTASLILSFPVVAGAIYEISGVAGFSGDTDNLSNACFRWIGSGATIAFSPEAAYLKIVNCDYEWIHTFDGSAQAPDRRFYSGQSVDGFALITPVTLNKPSGICRFRLRVPVLAAAPGATYNLQCFLRTNKAGSPTITAAYEVYVSRIK